MRAKQRTDLRKAEKNGLRRGMASLDQFTAMYHASIERKHRGNYHLFPLSWLERLEGVCMGAYHGERLVAAHFYLRDGDRLFYLLAASEEDALPLKPNDLLIWHAIVRAKADGFTMLHLGGGEPESLMHFKRKFSSGRVPYYTGRRVFLLEEYERLREGKQTMYFPAYRAH